MKREAARLSHKDFVRMMLISALTLLLSLTALVSMSWAWFSESEGSGVEKLTAANFDLSVKINGSDVAVSEEVALAAGTYEITLCPIGTAKSGYCRITTVTSVAGGESVTESRTLPIRRGEDDFVFTLVLDGASTVSFGASWGIATPAIVERSSVLTVGADGSHTVTGVLLGNEP